MRQDYIGTNLIRSSHVVQPQGSAQALTQVFSDQHKVVEHKYGRAGELDQQHDSMVAKYRAALPVDRLPPFVPCICCDKPGVCVGCPGSEFPGEWACDDHCAHDGWDGENGACSKYQERNGLGVSVDG
jgi:hypothetical protein